VPAGTVGTVIALQIALLQLGAAEMPFKLRCSWHALVCHYLATSANPYKLIGTGGPEPHEYHLLDTYFA
jgi:hypothetical protein